MFFEKCFIVVLVLLGVYSQDLQPCYDPTGEPGICKSIRDCPSILKELVVQQFNFTFIDYIHQSNAICQYLVPYICCVEPAISSPLPNPIDSLVRLIGPEEGCGWSNATHSRVVGGVPANLGAWPWMAQLGYEDSLGQVMFRCGATLITHRHLLTAAHCKRKNLVTSRLGEYDTSIDTETQHIDVPVAEIISHPSYDARDGNSDVAVVFLSQSVKFTTLIRPICLPISEPELSKNYVGHHPFIAGWGYTAEGSTSSTVLQEVQVEVFPNEVCVDRFRAINKIMSVKQFNNAVLCAGDLAGGKDSCQGDSGGPLMAPKIIDSIVYYYQIGIVSYGVGCGRANLPAVYSSVQTFTDWIQETISWAI